MAPTTLKQRKICCGFSRKGLRCNATEPVATSSQRIKIMNLFENLGVYRIKREDTLRTYGTIRNML